MGKLGILMLSLVVVLLSCGGPGVSGDLKQELQSRVDDLTAEEALLLLQDYHAVLAALKEDDLKNSVAFDNNFQNPKPEQKESTNKNGLLLKPKSKVAATSKPKAKVQEKLITKKKKIAPPKKNVAPPKKKVTKKKKKVHHKSWLHRWVGKLFHGRKTNDIEEQQEQQQRNQNTDAVKKEAIEEKRNVQTENQVESDKVEDDAAVERNEKQEEEISTEKDSLEDSQDKIRNDKFQTSRSSAAKKQVAEHVQQQQQQQQDVEQEENTTEKKAVDSQQHQQQRGQWGNRWERKDQKLPHFPWSKKSNDQNHNAAAEDFPFLSLLGKRSTEKAGDARSFDEENGLDVKEITRALLAKRDAIEKALLTERSNEAASDMADDV